MIILKLLIFLLYFIWIFFVTHDYMNFLFFLRHLCINTFFIVIIINRIFHFILSTSNCTNINCCLSNKQNKLYKDWVFSLTSFMEDSKWFCFRNRRTIKNKGKFFIGFCFRSHLKWYLKWKRFYNMSHFFLVWYYVEHKIYIHGFPSSVSLFSIGICSYCSLFPLYLWIYSLKLTYI